MIIGALDLWWTTWFFTETTDGMAISKRYPCSLRILFAPPVTIFVISQTISVTVSSIPATSSPNMRLVISRITGSVKVMI